MKEPIDGCETDEGYRGMKYDGEKEVLNARDLRNQKTADGKRKVKKQLKQWCAIEPVNGHLVSGHRLRRNYLSCVSGNNISVMLASAGYNFKRFLSNLKYFLLDFFSRVFTENTGQTALEMDFFGLTK